MGGPALHPSMLAPLLVMALAYTAFYLWVLMLRVRSEIAASKIRAIRMRQAAD